MRPRSGSFLTAGLVLVAGFLPATRPVVAVADPPARDAGQVRAAAAAVPLNDCWPTDFADPTLTGLSLTPAVLTDRPRGPLPLTIRVTAFDGGGPGPASGIGEVTVWVGQTRDATQGESGYMLHAAADGSWVRTLSAGQSLPNFYGLPGPGQWFIVGVSIIDRAGNLRDWRLGELESMGLPISFTVAEAADHTAPRLVSLVASPVTVNADARSPRVRLRARVTDARAGVARVQAAFGYVDDQDPWPGVLLRVAGTARNGVWRGRLVLPPWRPGTFTLSLWVLDHRGNERFYGAQKLRRLGQPWQLRTTGHGDPWQPSVAPGSLRVSPSTVDLRERDGAVRVTVAVRDRGSRVAGVSTSLEMIRSGYGAEMGRLRLTSGNRTNGIWSGTVRVDRCATTAGRYRLGVGVSDRAGNGAPAVRGGPVLTVLAGDHQRPGIAELDPWVTGPTAPVRLDFSEDVLNVVTPDVTIWDHPKSDTVGAIPRAPVNGTWACRTATATPADCVTGPVRTAAFTPAQPWQTGHDYLVDMAAPGTPGIRDLAGNPIAVDMWNGFELPGD